MVCLLQPHSPEYCTLAFGKHVIWTHNFFYEILIFSHYCLFKICYRYINEVVATRKLPLSAKAIKPKVVMKMDIEVSTLMLFKT
jgi:hypothetical protein